MGDIRDAALMRKLVAGCDRVVHLAGKAHAIDDPHVGEAEYQEINVEGTRNLLEASSLTGVRTFVFASTIKVFGEGTSGCVDERSPPAPRTSYAKSKWDAEQLVTSYGNKSSMATVSFRIPMVYGPTHKGNLYRMIAAIDRHRFPPLPRLRAVRSLLSVANFLCAVQAALNAVSFPLPMYVIADAKPYSTTEIYEALCRGLGRKAPRWRVPLAALHAGAWAGDVVERLTARPMPLSSSVLEKVIGEAWYSPAAAMHDLMYEPNDTFYSAVPEIIRYYRATV